MNLFEWDENKSQGNLEKHKISFDNATQLWNDPAKLSIPANCKDEPRYAIISKFKNKVWTAIYTTREEKIRIISVRRAREEEEDLYYEKEI